MKNPMGDEFNFARAVPLVGININPMMG